MLLAEDRRPVRKLWAAEILWPSVEQQQAMDSLYKVLRFWRQNPVLNQWFPLENADGELRLASEDVNCDLRQFVKAAADQDISMKEAAVELYEGPLLFQEYYEWTAEKEAFCELRMIEMLDTLIQHYTQRRDAAKTAYYKKKRERF